MRFAFLPALLLTGPLAAVAADTPTADEKAAMDGLAKFGGKCTIDSKLSPEARVSVKFEAANDVILANLKKYPQVGAVDVFDVSPCTAKGFAALKDLPNLRKFVAGRGVLNAPAVAAIGGCTELRHLALLNCGLTDAELAGLKDLTLLEHLALSENPGITDKGMAGVKSLERLRVLYMNKTSVGDKGLAELKSLDGLRTLSVKLTKVTAAAAERFADDMPNLRSVSW
jgi:hypothetical protein